MLLAKFGNDDLDGGASETRKQIEEADCYAFVTPYLFDKRPDILENAVELASHLTHDLAFVTELSNSGGIERLRSIARTEKQRNPEMAKFALAGIKGIKATIQKVQESGFIVETALLIQSSRRMQLVYRVFRPVILQRRASSIMIECSWRSKMARRLRQRLFDEKEEREWQEALVEMARQIADEALWCRCHEMAEMIEAEVVAYEAKVLSTNELQEHLLFKYGGMAMFFVIKLQVAVRRARERKKLIFLKRIQAAWRMHGVRKQYKHLIALAMADRMRRKKIQAIIRVAIIDVKADIVKCASIRRWRKIRTSIFFAGNLRKKLRALEQARFDATEAARIAEEARLAKEAEEKAEEQAAWEAAEVMLATIVTREAARLEDLRLMTEEMLALVTSCMENVISTKAAEEAEARRIAEEEAARAAEQLAWEAALVQLDSMVKIEAAKLRLGRSKAAMRRGVNAVNLTKTMEDEATATRIKREEELRLERVATAKRAMGKAAKGISMTNQLEADAAATRIRLEEERIRREEELRVQRVATAKNAMGKAVKGISLAKTMEEEATAARLKREEELRLERVATAKRAMGKAAKGISLANQIEADATAARLKREEELRLQRVANAKAGIMKGVKRVSMTKVLDEEGRIYAERTAQLQAFSDDVVGRLFNDAVITKAEEDQRMAAQKMQEAKDAKVFDDLSKLSLGICMDAEEWSGHILVAQQYEDVRAGRVARAKAATTRANKMLAARSQMEAEAKAGRLKRAKAAMKRGVMSIRLSGVMEEEGREHAEKRAEATRRFLVGELMEGVIAGVHAEAARLALVHEEMTELVEDLVEEVAEQKAAEEAERLRMEAENAREQLAWEAALEELDRIIKEETDIEALIAAQIAEDEMLLQMALEEEARAMAEKQAALDAERKLIREAELAAKKEMDTKLFLEKEAKRKADLEEKVKRQRRQQSQRAQAIVDQANERAEKSKAKAARAKAEADAKRGRFSAMSLAAEEAEEAAVTAEKVAGAAERAAGDGVAAGYDNEDDAEKAVARRRHAKAKAGTLSPDEKLLHEKQLIHEERERQRIEKEETERRKAEAKAKHDLELLERRESFFREKAEAKAKADKEERIRKKAEAKAKKEREAEEAKRAREHPKQARSPAGSPRRMDDPEIPKIVLVRSKVKQEVAPKGISVVMTPRTRDAAEDKAREAHLAMVEMGLGHMSAQPLMPLLGRNRNPAKAGNDLYRSLGLPPPNYNTTLFAGIQSSAGPAQWVRQLGAARPEMSTDAMAAMARAAMAPPVMGTGAPLREASHSAGRLRSVASVGTLPSIAQPPPPTAAVPPSHKIPSSQPLLPSRETSPRRVVSFGKDGRLRSPRMMNDLRRSLPPTEISQRVFSQRERVADFLGDPLPRKVKKLKDSASAPQLAGQHTRMHSSRPPEVKKFQNWLGGEAEML